MKTRLTDKILFLEYIQTPKQIVNSYKHFFYTTIWSDPRTKPETSAQQLQTLPPRQSLVNNKHFKVRKKIIDRICMRFVDYKAFVCSTL